MVWKSYISTFVFSYHHLPFLFSDKIFKDLRTDFVFVVVLLVDGFVRGFFFYIHTYIHRLTLNLGEFDIKFRGPENLNEIL